MFGRVSARRWGPGLALLLYFCASVLAPLLHSEREALWTEVSVEAHHTSNCLVLHTDAACASLADPSTPPHGDGDPGLRIPDQRDLIRAPADRPTVLSPFRFHRTRAPPPATI